MTTTIRTYSELITIPDYMARFNYLRLDGQVGVETFGFDRWLNQQFYHSKEWKEVRRYVILRDSNGDYCLDLAHPDYPVLGQIMIHHMNPIAVQDMSDLHKLLDPEFLVCTAHDTHNALHYGNEIFVTKKQIIERQPGDTCPWIK